VATQNTKSIEPHTFNLSLSDPQAIRPTALASEEKGKNRTKDTPENKTNKW
jgi:hypothetical protein